MLMTILTALIGSGLGGAIGWIARKDATRAEVAKVMQEAEKLKLENIQSLVDIYKEAAADLVKEVELLRTEIAALRTENRQLKQDMNRLEKTMKNERA